MAKHKDKQLQPLYDAAQQFVDVALKGQDSLFTPGKPIWSDATIQDLYSRFVLHPDTGSDSFETKFQRQLKGAPADTFQLAGELIYIHLLPGNSTTGKRKRELINAVLSWSPSPVEIPKDLANTLEKGIAAEGIAFRTRRPDLLKYLINFMRAWRALGPADQQKALEDPWRFKSLAFGVDRFGAQSQAEILLHLVHRESFEDIMSEKDKKDIALHFAEYVTEPTDDVDRKLLQIRTSLQKQTGKPAEFYGSELIKRWQPDADPWKVFVKHAKAFYVFTGFEKNERTYKLRFAERAKPAITSLAGEYTEKAFEELRKALQANNQNMALWRDVQNFVTWCTSNTQSCHQAMLKIADGEISTADRIRGFLATMPAEVVKSPASRTTLASLLLFALDPKQFVPFRSSVIEWTCRQVEYPGPKDDADEADRYEHALGFMDRVLHECRSRKLNLLDRLDAQGVIWAIAKWDNQPEGMPDSEWQAIQAYRGGKIVNPDPDDGIGHWKIAPGEGAELWEECRKEGYISIGWDDLGDLSNMTREQFEQVRDATAAKDPAFTKAGCEQVWRFAKDIKAGDRIVANKGFFVALGLGRVTGEYYFAESGGQRHRIPVEWYDTQPRKIEQRGWRITLRELDKNTFDAIASAPIIPDQEQTITPVEDDPVGRILLSRKNVVLYGPPGTGKTHVSLELAKRWQKWQGHDSVVQVTFHPSYAYEDFVEGFRPNSDGKFELQQGIFVQVVKQAQAEPHRQFLLVVDELNRGDVARIFGELITLIEEDKRHEHASRRLPYSKQDFWVPENLHLLGTMNTADRSISLLDIAIRRRFCFIECPPDCSVIRDSAIPSIGGLDLADLMTALNLKLKNEGIDKDRAIGHSHFLIRADEGSPIAFLRDKIRYNIIPLVEEYCYAERSMMTRILDDLVQGDGSINAELFLSSSDGKALIDVLKRIVAHGNRSSPAVLEE